MAAIIGLVILWLVIQVLLLAVATAFGFGLSWCIPDMSIGTGILIGLISSVTSIYFTVQLMKLGYIGALEEALNDHDEIEDDADPDVRLVLSPASKNRRQRSKKK